MTEKTEFISNNFDAVDKQIKEIAEREKAKTKAIKLRSNRLTLIYCCSTLIVVGFFLILLAWAYKIIVSPPVTTKTEYIEPKIVEVEKIKIIEIPVENLKKNEFTENQVGSEINSVNQDLSPITNYKTFKTINTSEFENYNISSVVTGWSFDNSNQKFPVDQYCYTHIRTSGLSEIRVDLADIKDGNYQDYVNNKLSVELGIPRQQLKKMQKMCDWASN